MEGIQTSTKLGRWTITRTLGKGATSEVKLGTDLLTNEKAAVKIIKTPFLEKMQEYINTEVAILRRLNHPNIIKLIEFHQEIDYYTHSGRMEKVVAIVLEYASGGNLYDYLASMSKSNHEIARTYFHQLINALEYCHNEGIAHRDLKPANLLLDANLNLKIADFGFASPISGPNNDGKLRGFTGTEGYMAPEILLKEPYSGPAVDLFACGVILFNMISCKEPFPEANKTNRKYIMIIMYQFEKFWDLHEEEKRSPERNYYSEDFRNLMNLMLRLNPIERLSLAEIKADLWFNGKTRSIDEAALEVKEKKEMLDKLLAKKKKEEAIMMDSPKAQTKYELFPAINPIKKDRGITDLESISPSNKLDLKKQWPLKKYEGELSRVSICQFFSVFDEKILFQRLVGFFKGVSNETTVSPKNYKITGRMITDDKNVVVIAAKIMKFDDKLKIIELNRREGSAVVFYEFVRNNLKAGIDHLCSSIKFDE